MHSANPWQGGQELSFRIKPSKLGRVHPAKNEYLSSTYVRMLQPVARILRKSFVRRISECSSWSTRYWKTRSSRPMNDTIAGVNPYELMAWTFVFCSITKYSTTSRLLHVAASKSAISFSSLTPVANQLHSHRRTSRDLDLLCSTITKELGDVTPAVAQRGVALALRSVW